MKAALVPSKCNFLEGKVGGEPCCGGFVGYAQLGAGSRGVLCAQEESAITRKSAGVRVKPDYGITSMDRNGAPDRACGNISPLSHVPAKDPLFPEVEDPGHEAFY